MTRNNTTTAEYFLRTILQQMKDVADMNDKQQQQLLVEMNNIINTLTSCAFDSNHTNLLKKVDTIVAAGDYKGTTFTQDYTTHQQISANDDRNQVYLLDRLTPVENQLLKAMTRHYTFNNNVIFETSERELTKLSNLNRRTVSKALDNLLEQKIIFDITDSTTAKQKRKLRLNTCLIAVGDIKRNRKRMRDDAICLFGPALGTEESKTYRYTKQQIENNIYILRKKVEDNIEKAFVEDADGNIERLTRHTKVRDNSKISEEIELWEEKLTNLYKAQEKEFTIEKKDAPAPTCTDTSLNVNNFHENDNTYAQKNQENVLNDIMGVDIEKDQLNISDWFNEVERIGGADDEERTDC